MNASLPQIALCCSAYLLGAVPFGVLITRFWAKTDVRTVGSGNIGATNVVRAAGRTAGIVTLLLDTLKAALPAYLGLRFFGVATGALAGGCAFFGHVFPIYLRFRGGKGVATGLGCFLALAPLAALAGLVTYGVAFLLSRTSGLSSLGGLAAVGLAVSFLSPAPVILLYCVLATVVVVRHKGNLQAYFAARRPRS
jgi:glycerol-3-phosphate acyltransferase PlsY